MLTVALLLVGFGLAWYVVSSLSRRINIIQSIVFAIIAYLASHIVISGMLFWVDQYSVKRTLFACGLFWGLGFIPVIIRRLHPEIGGSIKDYWMPGMALLLMLPFVWNSFEFYGMGQDEGVYQTQAICFINGITERQYDFEEYYSLGTEADQGLFEEAVTEDNLLGFYRIYDTEGDYYFGQSEAQAISERSGVFHGLVAYPALLALWGSIFGIRHMSSINVVILICCIFMLHELCGRFQMKRIGEIAALLVFACSPLLIWVTKSSLTEIGMTLNWVVFLYLILGDTGWERMLSAVCIWVYAFYHVSVYVFMPFYVLLYLALYLHSKDKVNLKAMLLAVVGYVVGYLMQLLTAACYTEKNYVWVYKAFITKSNVQYVVMAVCTFVILFGIYLLMRKKSITIAGNPKIVSGMLRGAMLLLILIQIFQAWKKGLGWNQLAGVTMLTYVIVSGIFIPLLVYGNVLISTERWLENREKAVMLASFFYCILIYSAFFKPGIKYCYYYARYLVMYIPILAIMGGLVLQQVKLWKAIVVTAAGMLCMLPYNMTLFKGQDDTRVEWDTLEQIAEEIQPGDNVIMDKELFGYYYFPLKAMTGSNLYPVLGDFEEESRRFYTGDNQVWYLTINYANRAEASYEEHLKLVNRKSEDYNTPYGDWQNPLHDRYLQLPYEFEVTEELVQLYRYRTD